MKFTIYRLISIIVLTILASIQFAQARPTEGDYAIIKFSQNNISADVQINDTSGTLNNSTVPPTVITRGENPIASTNNSIGIAINRSLRLSKFDVFDIHMLTKLLDDVYLNYGLFYDNLDYTNYANNKYNLSIKNRYGAYIGTGYDLTPKHAIYVNYGLSSINYEVDSRTTAQAAGVNNGTENNRTVAPILFVGLNYNIFRDFLLGFEYSRQKVDLESVTPKAGSTGTNNLGNRVLRYDFNTEIETFSLNLIYHFSYK